MNSPVHFATLQEREWVNLCGNEGSQVHGTLVLEDQITCAKCRKLWREGMLRVHALFKTYPGEQ